MSNSLTVLTAGQNLKHAAEKIDIVAIETAEISPREKKRNNAGGIYLSQSRNYDFFVFLVWFPPYVEGFVLTPTTGRYAQSTQSVAVWMTHLDKHFFYDTWKPGGLGAPPARHLIW